MNIRIPRKLLGNLNNYKFVALILDKDGQTVYRTDFIKNEEKDFSFFKNKIDYVTVPDDVFEECDSIVFFPFSEKTNFWTNKVIMWKNQEFFKMNGGYEFIKNSDVIPDMNKIKTWLDYGKNIEKTKATFGTKNLIYFTLFGKDEYVELLSLLLKSLKKQSYKNFELLFITDEETKEKIDLIEDLNIFKIHYHIVDSINDPVEASMQKLKIYEWKNINKYENILFLDVDIIVIGDLKKIFCGKGEPNVFYSATHNHNQSLHKTVYHCLVDYTDDQLKNFEKKSISAINAGQFFFKNTKTMKEHFYNINSFVKMWDGRYFFEQSFINYYFNLLEISDTTRFKEEFQFVSINENEINKKFEKNSVTVHFMGNACNGIGKLEFIKTYYKNYI